MSELVERKEKGGNWPNQVFAFIVQKCVICLIVPGRYKASYFLQWGVNGDQAIPRPPPPSYYPQCQVLIVRTTYRRYLEKCVFWQTPPNPAPYQTSTPKSKCPQKMFSRVAAGVTAGGEGHQPWSLALEGGGTWGQSAVPSCWEEP